VSVKTSYPLPGDFGLTRIAGVTGKLVSVGQRAVGSGSYFTHAFVYVGNGHIIEAEPGGARLSTLAHALEGGKHAVYSDLELTGAQRRDIVSAALSLKGTPYSFLDYLAIGEARILRTKHLEHFVADSGHMICSQLVDESYRRAGIDLFPGRLTGDVAPGDLARLIGA
jgi:cell wall-associated NlpC family hydrolase